MSPSRKKIAKTGVTTARSDKPFKVDEHRRERRNTRVVMATTADDTDPRLHPRPFGDPWQAPKDGKVDWTGADFEAKARRK
jgi:hypothetical protein